MTEPNSTHRSPQSEPVRNTKFFCTHIFADRHRCGSPALRGQTFCYYHHPSRRPVTARLSWNARRDAVRLARRTFSIPQPTCRMELQYALSVVVQALAANRVTTGRAGRLIDALAQLTGDLPETAPLAPNRHPLAIARKTQSAASPGTS